MHTLLCRFHPSNHTRPLPLKEKPSRGQIIVIFAVSLLGLIFFTGLAIDSGSLYITYNQLRRAVDASAVAAANDYKAEMCVQPCTIYPPKARMTKAAMEVLKLHNLDQTNLNLQLEVCDQYATGNREAALATRQPDFYNQCSDTTVNMARKLVWVEATQNAPLYFLSLLGFQTVPLKAHSISEAAPIDLVIVIDTSESMANETADPAYDINNYDPSRCNLTGAPYYPCQPLGKAKDAAKNLINTLYPGYDRVAVVGFDVTAKDPADIAMESDLDTAKTDVDGLVVRDDPPNLVREEWLHTTTWKLEYNPVYPEDLDGDGSDTDTCDVTTKSYRFDQWGRWDKSGSAYPWIGDASDTGSPCDDATKFDAYDWNNDKAYTADDIDNASAESWLVNHGCTAGSPPTCTDAHGNTIPYWVYLTGNSTCSGCGIRVGAEVLKRSGRPNAVWVMVFLSDGGVNLSDSHYSYPTKISSTFPLGYCLGGIGSMMWEEGCVDINKRMQTIPIMSGATITGYYYGFGNTRHCLKDATHCPPRSVPLNNPSTRVAAQAYTVYDYALDMADYAALNKSDVLGEIPTSGSDIAIYSIGLGKADATVSGGFPIGAYLLRYLAAVGDDGDRTTDECIVKDVAGAPSPKPPTDWCGQYYYTSTGTGLNAIFNDISKRIYTKLTQ